jgi:hypothetical protein
VPFFGERVRLLPLLTKHRYHAFSAVSIGFRGKGSQDGWQPLTPLADNANFNEFFFSRFVVFF